ncbi:glutamate synthase-related protein [Ferroplasma sp.]|uniref:FMN-binding glutamate synthase family protein n=1 Tax=Ferroplasma sp. TaxID=2591003 RepID=UPI00307EFB55
MNSIINDFMNVPLQKGADFWGLDKIKHIRQLAITGKPYEIFIENDNSLRILDNINFTASNTIVSNPSAQTESNLAGFKMSVPLYLGDMSYGALSGNPNLAIARSAELTKTMAGTGEGGLFNGISSYKRIFVQWASARFGVTAKSLNSGAAIVIKIGQGAKPGIGGHLPASKVTENISIARQIPENVDAISPAPHHDIYSIEDLSQRIESLKLLTKKQVFVKVAATNYIPYIVTGIARSGADGVIIDGHGAGTGATPMVIRDNLGIPVEMAVASSHDILLKENLRKNFKIIAAGRISNSTDAAKLYALGADFVSTGTGLLIAMGCIMVRKCNLGYCPTALTNKADSLKTFDIDFGVNSIINYINGTRLEIANILDNLNLKSISDLIGNKNLLTGKNLSKNTLKVLNIKHENIKNTSYDQGNFEYDKKYLNEMLNKGDPEITSMGSNAPPEVIRPSRIIDWLRLDGAQVTRPSIDPYRENIDLRFYLCNGKIKVSMPVIFDITGADDSIKDAILWASLFAGTMVIDNTVNDNYRDITIMKKGNLYKYKGFKYIELDRDINVSGYVIKQEDAEIELAKLNNKLKENGIREKYDILSYITEFRNSGDIAKYIALGSDAVILESKIFEYGLSTRTNMHEKALNLLTAIKKELALLCGAMGISSMQHSLSGNTELLRSINLDNRISEIIEVTEAGSP